MEKTSNDCGIDKLFKESCAIQGKNKQVDYYCTCLGFECNSCVMESICQTLMGVKFINHKKIPDIIIVTRDIQQLLLISLNEKEIFRPITFGFKTTKKGILDIFLYDYFIDIDQNSSYQVREKSAKNIIQIFDTMSSSDIFYISIIKELIKKCKNKITLLESNLYGEEKFVIPLAELNSIITNEINRIKIRIAELKGKLEKIYKIDETKYTDEILIQKIDSETFLKKIILEKDALNELLKNTQNQINMKEIVKSYREKKLLMYEKLLKDSENAGKNRKLIFNIKPE